MKCRIEAAVTYAQTCDADNGLAQIVSGTQTTQFGYDADGKRVSQTLHDGTQIAYVGGIEVTITGTQRITKTYYSAGAKVIAMRVMTGAASALYFVHTDHLGSVSLVTDGSGAVVSEQKYTAWGVVRAASGAMPTALGFTGQYADATGLSFFQARYYDSSLARFISADSVVPQAGNPQDFNRYGYARGNPLKYIDPTGHWTDEELAKTLGDDWYDFYFSDEHGILQDKAKLLEFLRSKKTIGDAVNLKVVGELMWTMRRLAQVGVHFSGVDAIGARLSATAGVGAVGGGTVDVVLNLRAGQLSYFGSPELGVFIGEGVAVVGGVQFLINLDDNKNYRRGFGSTGAVLGTGIVANGEYFWSGPLTDKFAKGGPEGWFAGAALGEAAGVYGAASYAVEGLRVSNAGYEWLPDPITRNPAAFFEVGRTIGVILVHDIALHPMWPWSPYR